MLSGGMGTSGSKSEAAPFETSQAMSHGETRTDMNADENEIEIHSDDNFEDPEDIVEGSGDDSVVSMRATTNNEDASSPPSETLWEQAIHDAAELENILFSIRRPTARHRLEKLVGALKILGSKLKRHEEVTTALNEKNGTSWRKRTFATMIGDDTATEVVKKDPTPTGSTNTGTVDKSKPREPPLLKPKDKFVMLLLDDGEVRCPNFFQTNTCPLGPDCNRVHVFNPLMQSIPIASPDYSPTICSRTELEKVYQKYRGVTLTNDNFAEKIKPDSWMKQRYTSRFTCPVEKIVYYAHSIPSTGIQSVKSSQGLFWFDCAKDAHVSLCTLVIHSLQQRKLVPETFVSSITSTTRNNKSSSFSERDSVARKPHDSILVLPLIHPWNWMEINFEDRCSRFASFQGCPDGKRCRFAHVHFPQAVKQDLAPSRKALPYAYLQNFGLPLADPLWNDGGASVWVAPKEARTISHFRIRYASDNQKRTWYTAAWKCPHEGTIYYAAGAKNGLVNGQNMFLYSSLEDAKLAVCGVILNSFSDRGLWGSWDEPPSPNRKIPDASFREAAAAAVHGSYHSSQQNYYQPAFKRSGGPSNVAERMTKSKYAGNPPIAEVMAPSVAEINPRPTNSLRNQSFTTENKESNRNKRDNDEEGEILEELFS